MMPFKEIKSNAEPPGVLPINGTNVGYLSPPHSESCVNAGIGLWCLVVLNLAYILIGASHAMIFPDAEA
jgi:hypothetical protein